MILLTIFVAGIVLLCFGYKLYGKYLEKQSEIDLPQKCLPKQNSYWGLWLCL